MKHCIQCGKEYEASPRAPKSFYCGNACKQSAYRDRQAQKARQKRDNLDPSFKRFLEGRGVQDKESLQRWAQYQRHVGIEYMNELMGLLMNFERSLRLYRPM